MLAQHKSHKPCKNFMEQADGCRFKEDCHFSHKRVAEGMLRCYSCSQEYRTIPQLMQHRKDQHGERCKNAIEGNCRYTQESCYLNHGEQTGFRATQREKHPPEPRQGGQGSQRQGGEQRETNRESEQRPKPTLVEMMTMIQAQMTQLTEMCRMVQEMVQRDQTPTL